ncbi:Bug family tripartite tricarboxylate transporter substrate binding protein [Variovorax sp.]|jgi:tripartite-type tricarboxylate transporter receptor subunit TctC|uniref:Bug family tripartite tricarboxylate transporter substrate binding protein n=1 Tax=Variovorax sp. TaxID=1871043 RepID=UPI0012197F61|nr:tripartite tricarboxylate transporter substrate binding protein [Variovorax sp.]TAJ57819.1 MAG: tripartite tricarboxylate transporter substrate binding protein [Variovorax sp.]
MKTLFVLAATATVAITAQAQDWPQRPVRVIVPFAAGASPDILARIVNDKLASRIGQPLIVENKPGAGGNSGTDQASKAAPDGYTFLLSVNAPLVYNTILYKNLPYDPFKDLVPVSLAATTPNVCAVSNGMNVDSVKGWLDAMKRNPGQFNFASTGNGSISHLGVELIKLKTRSFAVHIPYASSGQAVTAIIQGDVQFACLPPVSVMPQAKAGRLKAIAVTSAERSGLLPELPTLRESGLADIQAVPWFAYMAPRGTPDAIVQRMSREIAAVLKDPEVQKRLQTAYFDPVGSTPEALAKFMGEELRRWKPVIERTGLKPD